VSGEVKDGVRVVVRWIFGKVFWLDLVGFSWIGEGWEVETKRGRRRMRGKKRVRREAEPGLETAVG
jgi:hypothetical protein